MFTPEMLASVKKVEATRQERLGMEPRRMTAEEKDALLKAYHPDYREDGSGQVGGISYTELAEGFNEIGDCTCCYFRRSCCCFASTTCPCTACKLRSGIFLLHREFREALGWDF